MVVRDYDSHISEDDIKYIDFGTALLEEDIDEDVNQDTIRTTYYYSDPFTNMLFFSKIRYVTFEEYKKSDLWSLGILIYFFFSRRYPYVLLDYTNIDTPYEYSRIKYEIELIKYSCFYKFERDNNPVTIKVNNTIDDFNRKTGSLLSLHNLLNENPMERDYPVIP